MAHNFLHQSSHFGVVVDGSDAVVGIDSSIVDDDVASVLSDMVSDKEVTVVSDALDTVVSDVAVVCASVVSANGVD